MVTLNKENKTSSIYEIKHSTQIAPKQYSHLLDEERYRLLFCNPNLTMEERVLYGLAITKEEFIRRVNAHNVFIKEVDDSFKRLIMTVNKR